MYVYLYQTVENNVPFAWFRAIGRSIHEVATMFQRNTLRQEFIKEYINDTGTEFLVAFTNFRNYKFEDKCKYQLKTALSNTPGYMKLYIVTAEGEYFAKYYRNPVDTIESATWITLMPNTNRHLCNASVQAPYVPYAPYVPHLPTEDEEFFDYTPSRSILVRQPKPENADSVTLDGGYTLDDIFDGMTLEDEIEDVEFEDTNYDIHDVN